MPRASTIVATMTMNLPTLKFETTLEAVNANREAIKARRVQLKAELAALDGLEEANQALCSHEHKYAVYDPGYAGGGQDGYKCPDCLKRGYF